MPRSKPSAIQARMLAAGLAYDGSPDGVARVLAGTQCVAYVRRRFHGQNFTVMMSGRGAIVRPTFASALEYVIEARQATTKG